MELFRELSDQETGEFQQWARENWKPEDAVNPVWHPSVRNECAKMLDEHIRKTVQEYDAGTLDWNWKFRDQTVALDTSSSEISKEDQFELAVECFWEQRWEELTNGKG